MRTSLLILGFKGLSDVQGYNKYLYWPTMPEIASFVEHPAPDCFEILDSAATNYQVKLKESMFIKWEKPDLNQQVKHINLTLSL